MTIAIIPARGGSKRIHRKNIRKFFGKPIIAYSIQAARDSLIFNDVIVSTDDSEIASVAEDYGASVPFKRPDELSDDYATTWQVLRHVVEAMGKTGIGIDTLCCIYPIAPLISVEYIRHGYEMIATGNFPYVMTVAQYSCPIQRALSMDENKTVSPFFAESVSLPRSQDYDVAYHDASQFYWGAADSFISYPSLYSGAKPVAAIELPKIMSFFSS